ncbi:MAG TPA: hypothetical protein PKX92_02155 [Edaphocola sp.]|nr:hypothetical protein [Edaphocola sp.]
MRFIKSFIFGFILLGYGLQGNAQDSINIPIAHSEQMNKKNEIGIYGEVLNNTLRSDEEAAIGIQYKYWLKPNTALRFSAGYGLFERLEEKRILEIISEDSIEMGYANFKNNYIKLSAGLEWQKKLINNIYFYHSLDLSATYGWGKRNTYSIIQDSNNFNNYYISDNYDLSVPNYRHFVFLNYSIGIKKVYRNLVFGVESNILGLGYHSEKIGNKSSVGDFHINSLYNPSLRAFCQFRF